ncbi:sensor histidine kinase [Candidatus Deferrimicrobium sp.]|uniref:sensor histidine kinase n=1 Tax=Candidatus Deferrimicrobium sp. TaxID=3060586 RepID=UPI002ED8074A
MLFRSILFLFLLLSSTAILYGTALNIRTVRDLAETSMESTALALSTSAESALRSGGSRAEGEARNILSDRVVAYAMVAREDGTIVLHTNPGMVGGNIREAGLGEWLRSGKTFGRRIVLGTGLPAYEFNYLLHGRGEEPEILRLVLHTTRVDRILSDARRMWWIVGGVLVLLWAVGIALDRMFARHLRLEAQVERRERLALIGQMTATLSHEIRNALGSIKGFAQWVDERVETADPKKKGLAAVLQGTMRIESLVNDLLLFSREETYSVEPVDVGALAHESMAGEISGWKGEVELDPGKGTAVLADPEKLRRVLANGIRNAIQSMGERGHLRIVVGTDDRGVEIRIEDSGPGIPESEMPRLFTPFHTTKADGTGLGLAYSKKTVEGMNGEIDLTNRRETAGAVLTILLPNAG